jgi:hypothetical protein
MVNGFTLSKSKPQGKVYGGRMIRLAMDGE